MKEKHSSDDLIRMIGQEQQKYNELYKKKLQDTREYRNILEADQREIVALSSVVKEEKHRVDMIMAEHHEIKEKHRIVCQE